MANIILRLSTGTAGSTTSSGANNSLGGRMGVDASAVITTANTSLNNLFDNISKLENSNGTTDYRCIYIHNDTAVSGEVFANGRLYLQGSPKANISIGVGIKNDDANNEFIADESTSPVGVTFTSPTEGSPLVVSGDELLDIGDNIPVWIKRTANNVAGSGTVTDVISLVVRGIE